MSDFNSIKESGMKLLMFRFIVLLTFLLLILLHLPEVQFYRQIQQRFRIQLNLYHSSKLIIIAVSNATDRRSMNIQMRHWEDR